MKKKQFVCVCVFALTLVASAAPYTALRHELRAFHPDCCQPDPVKDPRSLTSYQAIERDLVAFCAANPDYDALDVRRACYLAMRRHFVPFLFKESPFYGEAGVNGGWSGHRPARLVNKLCHKFYREKNLIPDSAFALMWARHRHCLALVCGPFIDDAHHVPPFRTVFTKGFKGVREEVAAALTKCPANDPKGRKELETALVGLDTIHDLQLKFAAEAKARLEHDKSLTPEQAKNMQRIVAAAARCPWEPPRTFYEGLNTLWFVREIIGYVDGLDSSSLGHPDAHLIDFYRKEIAAGTLTKDEARDLVAKFLITADCHYDNMTKVDGYLDQEPDIPLTLGGCDEKGVPRYNELTELFLDVHLEEGCITPKLHCRISSRSPEAYLKKIGTMLMKGHAVFTLFNDDRHLKQFTDEGFSLADASSYIGTGCWSGFIDSVQDADDVHYFSMIKVLELTLNPDPQTLKECALELEPLEKATNFEELRAIYWGNFSRFIKSATDDYTKYAAKNVEVLPHPTYSMCLRGCLESRRDTIEGGSVSHPRILTLGFIGNTTDSLMAIKSVCFDRKLATVKEFLDAVRANWQGPRGEELRRAALAAPSWGDGTPEPIALMSWFMREANALTDGKDNGFGDKYRYAIYTYREFLLWGLETKATPDGRRDGDVLGQGFSPSEFRCEEGVTTVMNSIGKLPHECLYASNVNLTFDATAMNADILAAILRVFTEKGAHLIQPNCNSVDQLLAAQKNPELYRNLIVRVCGFSARFISLSKRWQDEVIARHRLSYRTRTVPQQGLSEDRKAALRQLGMSIDETRQYDVMNVGSNNEVRDIDYERHGMNGLNLAMPPQCPYYSLQLVKEYSHLLKKDAVLLLPICLFSSCLSVYPEATSHYPYYRILPPESIKNYSAENARKAAALFPAIARLRHERMVGKGAYVMNESEMEKFAATIVENWWKKPFGIRSLAEPFPEHLKKTRAESVALFQEMVKIAKEKGLRPRFLICPASSILKSKFPPKFYETYVYSFLREIDPTVPVLNFLEDEKLCSPGIYNDAFLLNDAGRELFMKALAEKVK